MYHVSAICSTTSIVLLTAILILNEDICDDPDVLSPLLKFFDKMEPNPFTLQEPMFRKNRALK